MFERMEISEAIYEGGSPSKNTQMEESDRPSYLRKKNVGASASPSKPNQVCSIKRKRINAGHPFDDATVSRKICLLHGPGYSSE